MDKSHKISRFDCLILLPIMALAFYIAFIPHQGYPYPVHIDEWVHLAYTEALVTAGNTNFIDPFFGGAALGLSANLEAGFHLFWGVFQQISGLSWITIFRYFPSIIFMITALSVYILARREGFGWEAAFFACLIPTTVGILGPAFLVPMSLGLLFIPLAMFLAFNFRNIWSYLIIFLFSCFLLLIHAPSAICLVIILGPYILLNLKGNKKHSFGLLSALVIPFLIPFPWIFDLLLPTAQGLLAPEALKTYVDFPRVIATFGYLPIAFCLLGAGILAIRGGSKNYGLPLGLLAMSLMLAIYYALHYGVSIMYERGLTFMMLMLGIVAGAGLMWVKEFKLPQRISNRLKKPLISQHIGKALCLGFVILILVIAIPARQNTPYYYMIDEHDYEAFVWIRDNISSDYEKAILDPWKATAFVAITQKKVFTRIHSYPETIDKEAYAFLDEGCSDTNFLMENNISIIYNRSLCDNPDLTEVRENIYLLEVAK